ncbi:MAG: NrdR family transcriptional regulator, partial [Acidimicrobiia bacterium]
MSLQYNDCMRCPFCHEVDDKVVDSRVTDEGAAI